MSSGGRIEGLWRHRMRAYYIPLVAGAGLVISALLPRFRLGDDGFGRVPDMTALSVLGLGILAILLALLSVATKKNSRHPLLLVGLIALGIEFLSWQWGRRAIEEQAWATTHAVAIVEGHTPPAAAATATVAPGLYLGAVASVVIVMFGMTIVVQQASTAYAAPDDDV